ncbi:hypothetical protein PC123_g19262 [Phytophthora cactorum]|nr:hypothetical protein PC123_g19262 [Phytophthora cactorum]
MYRCISFTYSHLPLGDMRMKMRMLSNKALIFLTRKSSPRATEALRQDFALHKYRRERLRKDRRRLLSLTDRAWRYANKA